MDSEIKAYKGIWFREEIKAGSRPERLLISEWTESRRILGPPAEEEGPFRFRRTPYLKTILDVIQNPLIEKVVICKPAQWGGTEIILNSIGFYADQEPASILYVMADEDTATYISRFRIQPIFELSPQLKRLIIP